MAKKTLINRLMYILGLALTIAGFTMLYLMYYVEPGRVQVTPVNNHILIFFVLITNGIMVSLNISRLDEIDNKIETGEIVTKKVTEDG